MTRQVDVKALVSHIVRGDGVDRCRICMGDTSEGQVHLEDTVMMDGDKPVTLAELLEVITGVEVEHTPPMPNKLCGLCKHDLTAMLPFMNLCRNSHKQWTKITDYIANITVTNKTKNVYINIGEDINTLTDTTRCPGEKISTRKDALKRFKMRLNRQNKYKIRTEKAFSKEKQMICPECKTQFVDLVRFNKHIGNLKKKMCGYCQKIIEIQHFKNHVESHNIVVFSCDVCLQTFEKEPAYLSHRMKHENGNVVCIECQKSFKNQTYLNAHTSKHKPVTCGCGKWLPNRTCFFNHKKKCLQHKNISSLYICDYCDKEYRKKNCLKMHIKYSHTVGRLFQCDKCGKKFSSRGHLLEHGNTHEKVLDRFVCYCSAKFSTRRGYQRHIKKHITRDIWEHDFTVVNALIIE
ncbi:uncharacterized protein LOC142985069 isoform X4 [Anticarsia gemmatalis]|uniref:uncharacterized protein LOC142985069 isoform X4 n=1 Tax=Anticarsia gemmatalis TaxID=129554 RepID=UPI003F75FDD8